jgi:signal transduction histidine kinase
MQTMIDEVTTITSLESGQYPLHLTPVDLNAFLDELLTHYAGIADVTSHLSPAIPHDLPCILADPRRLETILVNLLLNAHHAAPKASVRISANAQGQQVIISITDQGPGIPADEMPRIFDLFYRVEHGEQTKGIGLALAITKAWVIAQGGQIWVENVVGHGSTFSFTLPIAESACSGNG